MYTTTFTTNAYGKTLKGTVSERGWTLNRPSNAFVKSLDKEQGRKARLRCKAAAEQALAASQASPNEAVHVEFVS
jgi:hypothetical protein